MSNLRPLKIPYGLKDGRLVHVSTVDAGKACGCLNPLDEKTPLIARRGEKKRAHFAAKVMCDPVAARETVFHLLAKQTLSDRRCLSLPPIKLELDHRLYHMILKPPATIEHLEVASEQTLADSDFRADSLVSLQAGSTKRSLVVEWLVTHKCDAAKLAFLRSKNSLVLRLKSVINRTLCLPRKLLDGSFMMHPAGGYGIRSSNGMSLSGTVWYLLEN